MRRHDEDLERIRAGVSCAAVLEGTYYQPVRDVARASYRSNP